MALEPGARLDAYEIVRLLGSGGMGEVWLATEVRLGRKVALKLLPPDLTREPSRVLRFEQEARAASALSHPNVCTILALGETSDGLRYIAMEYVEGETLRSQLGRSRLSIRAALDLAVQVAAALSTAHASGIVHRDIKPENVMVRPDGLVKVLDFGLAKLAPSAVEAAGAESTRLVLKTDAGVVVGTAAYMSPEQARGQEVDARTDIWSLGVLLYEIVAGRSPFAAPSGTEVLAAILDRDPAPLARFDPDTPAELQRIVTKCLRKERALRYQGAQDLLLDLEALRDDVRAQARSGSGPLAVSATEPLPPHSSSAAVRVPRRKTLLLSVAGAVLVAAAAGVVWWWRAPHATPPQSDAGAVERTLTRLTALPGLQTDVTFSPDGRYIAYASDHGGNFDIWVQQISGGGDPVRVTKSPAADTEPAWSPDGNYIVFRSERDGGGLFLVAALGGPERRLASFGVRPKWSPDGSRILFSTAPPGELGGPLFIVGIDGSPPHRVLQRFTDGDSPLTWAWHPDGRRISVMVATNLFSVLELRTIPLEGGPAVVTTLPPPLRSAAFRVREFAWAPAGDALYLEYAVNLVWNVWRLRVNSRSLEAGAFTRLTAGTGQDTRIAVAHDGTKLALTIKNESIRLLAYPLDPVTGHVGDRGEPVTDASSGLPVSVSFARDGRRIAYANSGAGSGKSELWTADLATREKRLLARDEQIRSDPQWSRDGRRLVYQWIRSNGNVEETTVAVRDASSDDETLLSAPTRQVVQPHDWSPDGQSLLVSWWRPNGRTVLALWPIADAPRADAAATLVTEDPEGDLWQGRYSPNGRWISFLTSRPGRAIVCVVPSTARRLAVGEWRCLTDPEGWTDKPRWSSDGKLLYVWRRHGSLFNVWALRFDVARGTLVGSPFQVTQFDSPSHRIWADDLGASEPSVSRDRMMLPIAEATGSIWLLENIDK